MPFELLPVIGLMKTFYEQPRDLNRFKEYLNLLQGDTKGDLKLPIGGFNPMAKEHAIQKLIELEAMGAEDVMAQALSEINVEEPSFQSSFKVSLTLADDLKGGWTNRFTTDYSSKFSIQALARRGFCTPMFWTGESYTPEKIRRRTREYCYRTIFQQEHPKVATLEDHIQQEKWVARKSGTANALQQDEFQMLDAFYQDHKHSDNNVVVFNFFYGDEAAAELGYQQMSIPKRFAGYHFAKHLAAEFFS